MGGEGVEIIARTLRGVRITVKNRGGGEVRIMRGRRGGGGGVMMGGRELIINA